MQTAERPRFRQDLVAEPIEDGNARFIDVADPDTGNLFRFYEVEYSLACAMDGDRDVNGIVKWAQEELGLTASAKEVRSVIATLGSLGYLDSGAAAAAAVNEAAAMEASTVIEPAARPAVEARQAAAPVQSAPPSRAPAQPARPKTPPAGTPSPSPSKAPEPMAAKGPSDFELGAPGGRAAAPRDEMPRGGDMELGAPGAASGRKAPSRGGDDFALGASGAASNVSTDLAADMAISPADVKEAVRASQVMRSVDVPPELAAELEPPKPAARQHASSAAPARAPEPVAQRDMTPTPKPIEMPTERPVMPKAPTAPSSGPSPVLLVLLVLVLLGAGGFVVYKYVLKKDTPAPQKKVEAQPPAPVAPPAPPVESAKLAVEQPAPEEIKSSEPVTIATIVPNDSTVKAGDPVAHLVGSKPLETETANLQKQLDKAKADLDKATQDRDAAQTAGNKNGVTAGETKIAALQKSIATTEATLATKTAALDKFLIKSPGEGKITAVAKPNAKVTPTDIIATLARDPIMVATFKSAGEVAQDAHVLLAIKGSEQKLSCTVVATGGDGTKIACPKDAAPEGTEVTYAGVDPNAPSPDETKPAESPVGSAAPAAPAAPADVKAPADKAPAAPTGSAS